MWISHDVTNANEKWLSNMKCTKVRSSTAVLSNLRLYVSQEHIHLDAVYQKLYYMLVLTVQDMAVPKYDCMLSSFTPLPLNDAVSVTIQWMCKCNLCTVFMWLQWRLYSWEIQYYLSLTHGVLNVRLKWSSMYSVFLKSINQIIPACYVCVFKAASTGVFNFFAFTCLYTCIYRNMTQRVWDFILSRGVTRTVF